MTTPDVHEILPPNATHGAATPKPTTRVVRNDHYGSAKFHIKTSDHTSACGATPSTVAGWLNSGDRAGFELRCPERICKRCIKASA